MKHLSWFPIWHLLQGGVANFVSWPSVHNILYHALSNKHNVKICKMGYTYICTAVCIAKRIWRGSSSTHFRSAKHCFLILGYYISKEVAKRDFLLLTCANNHMILCLGVNTWHYVYVVCVILWTLKDTLSHPHDFLLGCKGLLSLKLS